MTTPSQSTPVTGTHSTPQTTATRSAPPQDDEIRVISPTVASDIRETPRATTSRPVESSAVVLRSPTTTDRVTAHARAYEAEKNFQIDPEAGLRLLVVGAELPALKGDANKQQHAVAKREFYTTQKFTEAQVKASAKEAGKIKFYHLIPTDISGLTPSAVALLMRLFHANPMAIAVTNTVGQVAVQAINPRFSARNMVPILQRQQQERMGIPQRFGAAGDLYGKTVALRNATIRLNKATPDNRAERLADLERVKFDFDDNFRQHLTRYETLLPENAVRIIRSALVAIGFTVAFADTQKHPNHVSYPTVFLFQLTAVALSWLLSYKWGGVQQETLFQLKTIDTDLQVLPAKIAQGMVQRQTGEIVPFGPELAQAVRDLGVLDAQAQTEVRNLWKRQIGNLVVMAQSLFNGQRRELVESLAEKLDLPVRDVAKRQVLLDRGIEPMEPLKMPPLADRDAQMARQRREDLWTLNRQVDARRNALPAAEREAVDHLQTELREVFADIGRLKQGPAGWASIQPARQELLLSVMDGHKIETAKKLAHYIHTDFLREQAGHSVQKYAKGWPLVVGGAGFQLVMGAAFTVMAAAGKPVPANVRFGAMWGQWFLSVLCEVAGGALVTDKNQNRTNWRAEYPYAPPSGAKVAGLVTKAFVMGSMVLLREAGRLPYAKVATIQADKAIANARRLQAGTVPLGQVTTGSPSNV